MTFIFRYIFFWGMLLFLFVSFGLSNLRAFPRLVSKVEYLDLLGKDDTFKWTRLFELSLEASGVTAGKRAAYRAKLNVYVDDLAKLLEPLPNDYEKGEKILRYMYGFLKQYQALQTRVDTMFDSGVYNCVSSAILYASLARAFGLKARSVGTYSHTFVILSLADGRHIDVETTSKYGFDPGQKKEFIDNFTSTTGLVYVPKNKYAKRNFLSDAEFISLILQNRLYILNKNTHSFRILQQMIPLAADLATLTQAERDIQNFFSMVSQYSFNLSEIGKVDQAIRFTDSVLDIYGNRESIAKVRNTIAYNEVLKLIQNRKYPEVEQRLADYNSANLLDSDSYKKLVQNFKSSQLEELVNSAKVSFDEKLAAVENIAKNDTFNSFNLQELYQVIYGNEVYARLKLGKFKLAMELLSSYPPAFRNRSFYLKMYADIENAYVIDLYNQSVSQINTGAYDQAEHIIAKGLRLYPNNNRLLQLRSRLLKIRANAS